MVSEWGILAGGGKAEEYNGEVANRFVVKIKELSQAFDSMSHNSRWKPLEHCGIEPQYFSLLKRLYAEQKAAVLTDKVSDMFGIKRRRKQGDPLSSLVFNTVFYVALKDDLARWQKTRAYA